MFFVIIVLMKNQNAADSTLHCIEDFYKKRLFSLYLHSLSFVFLRR